MTGGAATARRARWRFIAGSATRYRLTAYMRRSKRVTALRARGTAATRASRVSAPVSTLPTRVSDRLATVTSARYVAPGTTGVCAAATAGPASSPAATRITAIHAHPILERPIPVTPVAPPVRESIGATALAEGPDNGPDPRPMRRSASRRNAK